MRLVPRWLVVMVQCCCHTHDFSRLDGWPMLNNQTSMFTPLHRRNTLTTYHTHTSQQAHIHVRSPCFRSNPLSDRLGCNVWLKMDCMQPSGSFKLRGLSAAVANAASRGVSMRVGGRARWVGVHPVLLLKCCSSATIYIRRLFPSCKLCN